MLKSGYCRCSVSNQENKRVQKLPMSARMSPKKIYYKVAQCSAPDYKVTFGPKNILPENQDNEERALLKAIHAGQRSGFVSQHVKLVDWFEKDDDGTKTIQALVQVHEEYQVHVFGECSAV